MTALRPSPGTNGALPAAATLAGTVSAPRTATTPSRTGASEPATAGTGDGLSPCMIRVGKLTRVATCAFSAVPGVSLADFPEPSSTGGRQAPARSNWPSIAVGVVPDVTPV